MSDEDYVQARVFVSGRVQGVFFRVFVRQKASEFGVTGYVRNLNDGRVEAVFQGAPDKVHAMIKQVHEGPQLARVDEVSVHWEEVSEVLSTNFRISY